ncbi:MAG: 4-hydroxythreonine-4-phosphate dehydrogenase PdxA [Candidatus Gastranaerophilales bacterium]|nr:4-hydroxythreonine-4-phosphate dehydrogenase PdxA [Candidatus Gastranaerophilales bacterium]
MNKILVKMGDAEGIGVEIILKSFQHIKEPEKFILIGNKDIFQKAENQFNLKLPSDLEFINIDYDADNIKTGIESKYSGELAYLCLKKACDMVNNNLADKIATAPLSKNALHLAGYNYSGQTEILESNLGNTNNQAQMLFVADNLKILLLTRHEAIIDVPKLITKDNITQTVKILNKELIEKFNIKTPKIAMCALNPHAGENGILGREEIDTINPAIKKLNDSGINIHGSFSADTLIGKAVKNYLKPEFDAYIACYHDQALPAVKSLGLEKVLNITIGLSALRSSPSHGTAFDIAGKNIADYKSMLNSMLFLA